MVLNWLWLLSDHMIYECERYKISINRPMSLVQARRSSEYHASGSATLMFKLLTEVDLLI
jgi:hypothetical protein